MGGSMLCRRASDVMSASQLRDAVVVKPRTRLLIAGAGAVATTANAIRPVGRGRVLSIPAFALGLGPSEFPLHTGLAQLAIGGLLSRSGGTRGWRGKLGITAHVASVAGLVVVYRTAQKTSGALDAALAEGLGADDRVREQRSPRPEVVLTGRQLVTPTMGAQRRYRSARDVSYGEFGVRNQLDVWKRRDLADDARAPVLFQVHGGAWTMGSKQGQGEPLMGHLAERGWVCVTVNYRLSPTATWPDHIVDVKRALAWTKANIADHGGDPGFVVITGGSAGGHLCALAALTPNLADFQPGFEDDDTSVAAAVPFYGVYDFTDRHGADNADLAKFLAEKVFKSSRDGDCARWEQASPITHVGPHAPPFFVLHGTNDSLVPIEQSRAFVDELRMRSKQPVVYAELPGAQHAFDTMPSVRTHAAVHAVERFLAVVRNRPSGPTPADDGRSRDTELNHDSGDRLEDD
jgi:acetyl esterase/lipase